MDIKEILRVKTRDLEPAMRDYARLGDEGIDKMVFHPIDAGGKRIRPALTILASESVGGRHDVAVAAAASIELLHTFTLVHDDIMDHDDTRRGKPTVHNLWGDEMGILVGDTLYSSAFKALVDAKDKGLADGRVIRALNELIRANSELQMGQMMDMLFESRDSVDESEYILMINKKTGALIEAAVKIGAIVGGADEAQIDGFSIFGANCGLAFQIKDDILDLIADRAELGKPVGSDIKSGKKTIIIIHALKTGTSTQKEGIHRVLGREDATDEEIKSVISILEDIGSIKYAEEMVEKLTKEAIAALDVVGDCEAKEQIIGIATFLVSRRT